MTLDNATQIKKLGSILGVWAHPDDEVFTCGGLLAIAAANGQTVMCMTASRGEAGVQDESRWPRERLGDIRTHELKAAYDELGISQHCWFDYSDGELAQVPLEEGIESVKQCIADCNPDTIISFGPDGMTGHDDHKAVAEWAKHAANERGITLYQAVLTPESYAANQPADEQFNMFFNIEKPPIVSRDACAICIDLDEETLSKKCRALKAMPSQTEKLIQFVGDKQLRDMQRIESFVLAK